MNTINRNLCAPAGARVASCRFAASRPASTSAGAQRFFKKVSKYKATKAAYHAKNKAEINERHKQWKLLNKIKMRQYSLTYKQRNREKVRSVVRAWKASNPSKKRSYDFIRRSKLGLAHCARIELANLKIKRLFLSSLATCPYCSACVQTSAMQVDHILPISRGGLHDPDNVCLACKPCNLSKGSKILFVEWTPPNLSTSARCLTAARTELCF